MRQNDYSPKSGPMSRRQFIKLAAAAGLLAGCNSIQKSGALPTSPPATLRQAQDVTSAPPTRTLTAIPATAGPPDVIKFYPEVPSKVVQTHHTGVWAGEHLSPEAIRQMLDASITELTGLNDSREAWSALF